MKKKSPLAMMKNCKVRKYSEGGGVFGEYQELYDSADSLDPSGYDSLPVEVFEQDTYVSPEDWDFGHDQSAYEQDLLQRIADMPYRQTTPDQTDEVLSLLMQLGGDPNSANFAGMGLNPNAPTSAVGGLRAATEGGEGSDQTKPEKTFMKSLTDWMGAKNLDGSSPEKIDPSKLSKEELLIQALLGRKEEPSNWQKLLQLGMVGIGGLTSYKDAQAKNKALKQAYGKMDEREAAAQRHFGNVNRSGSSYAYNTPAINKFRRPT
jgi:hypothetical protein